MLRNANPLQTLCIALRMITTFVEIFKTITNITESDSVAGNVLKIVSGAFNIYRRCTNEFHMKWFLN